GTCTPGIAPARTNAASGSTACAAPRSRTRSSSRARASSPVTSAARSSPAVARWEVERGARALTDGSAINEQTVGSAEWLIGEILRYRGEAELLEPPELRSRIAKRAQALARELGVTRLRASASA